METLEQGIFNETFGQGLFEYKTNPDGTVRIEYLIETGSIVDDRQTHLNQESIEDRKSLLNTFSNNYFDTREVKQKHSPTYQIVEKKDELFLNEKLRNKTNVYLFSKEELKTSDLVDLLKEELEFQNLKVPESIEIFEYESQQPLRVYLNSNQIHKVSTTKEDCDSKFAFY